MTPYIIVFIVCLAYWIIAQSPQNRDSKLLLGLFFLYLAIFVGMGDMIGGYDRYIYGEVFDTIADETRTGRNYRRLLYLVQGKEYGYFFWQVLVSHFTENRYIFILVTTIAAYTLYFFAFKQYIKDYPLAAILFLGLFYYFTMTYLRQVLACGIIWLSFKYIWERKPINFFALVLLAYSFHSSALIFAVMYFIPFRKYSKGQVTALLIVALLVGLTPVPMALMASSDERTAEYEDQMQGFRPEYVLEVLFFIFILFKNYKWIPEDKKTLTMLNCSFVLCGILLLFMRFGQGGRISWLFFFGLFYMLTTVSDRPRAFSWMKPLLIVVSFALFMRITFAWSSLNVPYHTFLVDGLPCGNTYQTHEYDWNYHNDKFCRKALDPVF